MNHPRTSAASLLAPALLLTLIATPVRSQTDRVAYPAGGQDEKQQENDRFARHEYAVGTSRHNPRTSHL